MKAIGARKHLPVSDPECLVEFDAEMPAVRPHDLLVRVMATAVNPVDAKMRASLGGVLLDSPRILGSDAAGVVVAVGSDATGFVVQDEVYYSGDLTRQGSNAEFQAVDSRLVACKPRSWSFVEAAAIPLVGLTAWELLFERMGVDAMGRDSGKTILIINGAGGVGSALIPLARSVGLTVVATASRPETSVWCSALGAHHVINHRLPLRPQVEAVGVTAFPYIANLFNTEAYWETTADLIAPFGTLGLIVEPREKLHLGDPYKAKCVRIAWEFMAARARYNSPDMHVQGDYLAEISRRCDAGDFPKIHTRIYGHLTAENLREAHTSMEAGTAYGKWVFGGV